MRKKDKDKFRECIRQRTKCECSGQDLLKPVGTGECEDDSTIGKQETVNQSHTTSPKSTSVEAETVSDIVAKLQQGKKAMAERCKQVGKAILDEAGVQKVEYHTRLRGSASSEHRSVHIPTPTTRRRLYILAHEAAHVALNHCGAKPKHRQEYEAERYAHDALRRHGIAVSKKSTKRAKEYVAWKIRQALRRGAKSIDRESFNWCQHELLSRDRLMIKQIRLADLG